MRSGKLKHAELAGVAAGAGSAKESARIVRTVKPAPKRGTIPLAAVRRAVAEVIAARKK